MIKNSLLNVYRQLVNEKDKKLKIKEITKLKIKNPESKKIL